MFGTKKRKDFDKFERAAQEQVWIQNWMNAYEDGKTVAEKLTAELEETRTSLAKMTVERDRLYAQCKLLKITLSNLERSAKK